MQGRFPLPSLAGEAYHAIGAQDRGQDEREHSPDGRARVQARAGPRRIGLDRREADGEAEQR